jgi:putative hydrolase of HD superfamily
MQRQAEPAQPSVEPRDFLVRLDARLAQQLRFLIEADRLKYVLRGNRLADGRRRENTAEHSWHLALFACVLSEWSAEPVDTGRVIVMLLLHDLVEIEARDTPLYLSEAADQEKRERVAAEKIFGLLPVDQREALHALWREFEDADSPDAKFAKSLDRFQPVLLNHLAQGGTWLDYQMDEATERRLTSRMERGSPTLWRVAEEIFGDAVKGGWLG